MIHWGATRADWMPPTLRVVRPARCVGDRSIDRRVNGGRIAAEHIVGVAEYVRHDAQIRDTSLIDNQASTLALLLRAGKPTTNA